MKWFRFWTDTLDDVKILQLSDYEYRIWTYLLAIASEVNSMSGECQVNVKSMSLRCRTQVNHFSRALETFQELGLITMNGAGYPVITNWNKRQYKSDNVTARVHKHREVISKRNVSCNVSETHQITDTDTDTEKEKHFKDFLPVKEGKNKGGYSDEFEIFYAAYPNKKAKMAAWDRWLKMNGIRPNIEVILGAIQRQIDWRADAKKGEFRPEWKHPATWLRNGCWDDESTESIEGEHEANIGIFAMREK
jgi:hypothetical protein